MSTMGLGMKVEFIQWYDASSDHGWQDCKDVGAHKGLTYSVGFVIKETKQAVVLANTWDEESDTCNCLMTIPLGMIKKRRVMWQSKTKKQSQSK